MFSFLNKLLGREKFERKEPSLTNASEENKSIGNTTTPTSDAWLSTTQPKTNVESSSDYISNSKSSSVETPAKKQNQNVPMEPDHDFDKHLVVGSSYTRSDVAELVDPNDPPTGGDWITSYVRVGSKLIIFLNIGIPGSTGHDFENRFERATGELIWFSKPNKKSTNPLFKQVFADELKLLFFVRYEKKGTFEYLGQGHVTKFWDNSRTMHGISIKIAAQIENWPKECTEENCSDESSKTVVSIVDIDPPETTEFDTSITLSKIIHEYSDNETLLKFLDDEFLATTTLDDFYRDFEDSMRRLKLIPNAGEKFRKEFLEFIQQNTPAQTGDNYPIHKISGLQSQETFSGDVSIYDFIQQQDCSFFLKQRTDTSFFRTLYLKEAEKDFQAFEMKLQNVDLSSSLREELISRVLVKINKKQPVIVENKEDPNHKVNIDSEPSEKSFETTVLLSELIIASDVSADLDSLSKLKIFQTTQVGSIEKNIKFWSQVRYHPDVTNEAFWELKDLIANTMFVEPSRLDAGHPEKDINITSVILSSNCSARLKSRAHDELFLNTTMEDVFKRPNEFWSSVGKINYLGKKSINELQSLIDPHQKSLSIHVSENSQSEIILTPVVSLAVLELCALSSVRAFNLVDQIKSEFSDPIEYAEAVACIDSSYRLGKGVGRTTASKLAEAFKAFVTEFFSSDPELADIENLTEFINNPAETNLSGEAKGKINDYIQETTRPLDILIPTMLKSRLGERYQDDLKLYPAFTVFKLADELVKQERRDVLAERYGLFGNERKTLEELGISKQLTRERIRQIIEKALSDLRHPMINWAINFHFRNEMPLIFEKAGIKNEAAALIDVEHVKNALSNFDKLCLDIVDIDVFTLVRTHGPNIESSDDTESVVHTAARTTLSDPYNSIVNFRDIVSELIQDGNWPLSFELIKQKYPDLTDDKIKNLLNEKLKLKLVDNVISGTPKLRTKEYINAIFSIERRELSPLEISSTLHTKFNKTIGAHIITNALKDMDTVLIVKRGMYNTYKNLDYPAEKLTQIREFAYKKLLKFNEFMSAQKLFENFIEEYQVINEIDLNPYVLLGILQDDERFISKPGLMIGLRHEGSSDFRNLNDTLVDLVSNGGPISIDQLQAKVSMSRNASKVSLNQALARNKDIVRSKKETFDLAERVIGPINVQTNLLLLATISLLIVPTSFVNLRQKLALAGYDFNEHVIESFVRSNLSIEVSAGIVKIDKIQEVFAITAQELELIASSKSLPNTISASSDCDISALEKLLFQAEGKSTDSTENEKSIITDILNDFM